MSNPSYLEKLQDFREARDQRMKTNPHSWLALIGLFRLAEGNNPFGSGIDNKIVLPEFIQERCGSFNLENGNISLVPTFNSNITVNGMPPDAHYLRNDRDEEPDKIESGTLTMMILLRGDNYYLRVWDKNAVAVRSFTGLKYFPVNPEFKIKARFIRYDPPKAVKILDIIGTACNSHLFGEAHFTLRGIDCSLVAEEDEDELLFSFTDETRTDLTYPGGRFLTAPKPENEYVILDFNQALNWPCAFTAFATCPLPPRENHLSVCIEAGEMRYQK
jgi:uncharacterized protein (DUF1684 family)